MKKALAIIALIVLVLFLAAGVWWHDHTAMPVVTIPSPKLPSPNAYDDYVAASRAVRDRDKIEEAVFNVPGQMPPKLPPIPGLPPQDRHIYTLAEKTALVAENAPALAKLYAGFRHRYWCPPDRSNSLPLPFPEDGMALSRLLRLQADIQMTRGQFSQAALTGVDLARLGTDIPHGAIEISMLEGIGDQAVGRLIVWNSLNHLDAKQSLVLANRLAALDASQFSLWATIQEEKWWQQAMLVDELKKPTLAWLGNTDEPTPLKEELYRLQVVKYGKRRIFDGYTRYMDEVIGSAKQPYAARLPEPPPPNDPVTVVIVSFYSNERLRWTENRAQNALLNTTLALHAYRLDHSHFPSSLSDLEPHYLKFLPSDPFALSGPLRYRLAGDKYVLYSIGPDGVDDGGKAIMSAVHNGMPENGHRRYLIWPDSKGDIVAGVNVY